MVGDQVADRGPEISWNFDCYQRNWMVGKYLEDQAESLSAAALAAVVVKM
jgi:hypothetical protein